MAAHASRSPSKRSRWGVCPGSIREEAKFPEQRSGPSAIDGTHTHSLLEHCLKSGTKPADMVGHTIADHDGEFTVDVGRAARVQIALDYIESRVAHFNGLCEVRAEARVDPGWFLNRDDAGGTVDVQIRSAGVLEIIDLKDGMQPVEAAHNPQLLQYALGVLAECKLAYNVVESYPWQEVRITIIQPKLKMIGKDPVSTWTISTAELLTAELDKLSSQLRATDNPDAPLVPGETQCKYCRAKGACAALASDVMKEVGIMFQPVVTQTLDVAQQSADKDPSQMDDQQIRQILEAAPLMRQLLEGVEKEAQRRMESGQTIPGLKLVHGRGARAWALPEEEMADKLVKMGIPKTAIYETKLVTPAKAEKLTWEKRDGTKVSLTDRQLKRMEQEYVVKMAGKLVVAPETDSRPAVVLNAAPMFSAVEAAPAVQSLPSWLS